MTFSFDFVSHSATQTHRLGARLGGLAQAGDVILLEGPLGAGKTCLAQGVAEGLGVAENPVSPSFIYARGYRGRLPFYHIDLFRIEGPPQLLELGIAEYLEADGVCVVEWADRALEALPREHLLIRMDYVSDTKRSLRFMARGSRHTLLLEGFRSSLLGLQEAGWQRE